MEHLIKFVVADSEVLSKPAPHVSLPEVRPVKSRKQNKVLLILNGRKHEKDPIYRNTDCSHVEAT